MVKNGLSTLAEIEHDILGLSWHTNSMFNLECFFGFFYFFISFVLSFLKVEGLKPQEYQTFMQRLYEKLIMHMYFLV